MDPGVRTKVNFLALILMMLFAVDSADGKASKDLNQFQSASIESDEQGVVITLDFEKPVKKFLNPVFFKKSFHIDFPKAVADPSKRNFFMENEFISQVYVSQFSDERLRIRFILRESFESPSEKFQFEKEGATVRMMIEASPIDVLGDFISEIKRERNEKNDPQAILNPSESIIDLESASPDLLLTESYPAALPSVKEAEVRSKPVKFFGEKEKVPPKEQFLEYEEPGASEVPDLMDSSIKMFSMLSVVLGLMFFLFFIFKKFVLKNSLFGSDQKMIQVLSTGMLGPKKIVTLVEVAGEVLVLGISNDNISLLSTITDEEKIAAIKNSGSKISPQLKEEIQNTSRKDRQPLGKARKKNNAFPTQLKKQIASLEPGRAQSVAGITKLIRKNMGKIKAVE